MPQIPKMKAPALIKELKKRKIKPEKLPPPLPVTAAAPASRSAEPTAAVDGKTGELHHTGLTKAGAVAVGCFVHEAKEAYGEVRARHSDGVTYLNGRSEPLGSGLQADEVAEDDLSAGPGGGDVLGTRYLAKLRSNGKSVELEVTLEGLDVYDAASGEVEVFPFMRLISWTVPPKGKGLAVSFAAVEEKAVGGKKGKKPVSR